MSKVIAVTNQKGGVGKTTTAINLSASLAANDYRVLLIDSDPQGNATSGLGIEKEPGRATIYDALLGDATLDTLALKTGFEGLDIVPADKNLVAANLELVSQPRREFRLRDKVNQIRDNYQYILIDCPPALDLLTLNDLLAADSVLIPIQCEFFALEGISELFNTIDRIRDSFHHNLRTEGILLTMFDDRTTLVRQVAADLRSFFKGEVLRTVIPRNIRLAEAPSYGKSILSYDVRSKGAESYIQLAKEILANEQTGRSAKKSTGKGLTALLPNRPDISAAPVLETPSQIRIADIDPNPVQPRRVFDPERLQELAKSIQANGIIQPIVVRPSGGRYQLVAGERRWRAAHLAGLEMVPAVIRDIPDDRLLEITLVENIQREDLNPIETALAFDRLARELNLSHEQIGERTGKDRSTITNLLRLLQLPEDLQKLVANRRLSQGHARCLLGIPAELQREVAEKAVAQGLSVRQVENLTQQMTETRKPKSPKEISIDPNVKAAIQELERVLSTKVRIVEKANNSGRIEIDYYSTEDLDRIYTAISGTT